MYKYNYIHYNVWDEITYPFLNFNGATVEALERISNFTLHFARHVITYPCSPWARADIGTIWVGKTW